MTWWRQPAPTPRSAVAVGGRIGDEEALYAAANAIGDLAARIGEVGTRFPSEVPAGAMRGPAATHISSYADGHGALLSRLSRRVEALRPPILAVASALDGANAAFAAAGTLPWPEDLPVPHPDGPEDEAYPHDARVHQDRYARSSAAAQGRETAVSGFLTTVIRSRRDLADAAQGVAHLAAQASGTNGVQRFVRDIAGAGGGSLMGLLISPLLDQLATIADLEAGPVEGLLAHMRSRLAGPTFDLEDVEDQLGLARDLGFAPRDYAATLERYWELRAADSAGIDLLAWDPSRGSDANRLIIEDVYRYYGDLYLSNPDLHWAGMANMIGPSFAAGFFDLDAIRGAAQELGQLPDLPGLPDISDAGDWTDADLEFFETTFLEMQRKIFLDMAPPHQAYREGGMDAIREMAEAGVIPQEILDGWRAIDSGDHARVQFGNTEFLLREQKEIIELDYQAMRDHSPTGDAMTYVMTLIGQPSIPGARSYPDVFPLVVSVETPGPERIPIVWTPFVGISADNPLQGTVHVTTPLANGNIANFDDRWDLITQDTLPAFQDLITSDPDRAEDIIGSDVADRIDEFRLHHRLDEILAELDDFSVDVDQ